MSKTPYLDTLSEVERRELQLCGISEDAQLKKTSVARLWNDLQQAHEFFPDKEFVLTEERLKQILAEAPEIIEEEAIGQQSPKANTLIIERRPAKSDFFHTVSMEGRDANMNPETTAERIMHAEKVNGLSRDFHAICCIHPHRIYMGAAATALLLPTILALVIVPILLVYGYEPLGKDPKIYGAALVALVLPYYFFLHMAQCSVCHIKLFTFRPYPHHKGTHNLPILGPTFATALHILVFFQFRCPACGTQMKLFGRSSSRRRRSKKEIRIRNREQKDMYKKSTHHLS